MIVSKKVLSNGMNVLVRSTKTVPEVSVQLWYNVGSKHENANERGMAHLIEHMIFKGTKKLSETDIDLITTKLSGYANAFTSNDYTAYIFKFPSNVWHNALMILSDCMKNARFDEQMLNSELHAVVQELKMYKDDYQEALLERMFSGIFPQHPYHHPVIGYKQDLIGLTRENLYNFYKKHYYPANATLVVVGDVVKKEVFNLAEKYFGKISNGKKRSFVDVGYRKNIFFEDVYNTTVRLPREVDTPWSFYLYKTPGISSKKTFLFDMVRFLFGGGRSSRLYEKLVNETKLATFAGCFDYSLFEKSLFSVYVQPTNLDALPRIEKIIDEELLKLANSKVESWEFSAAKKRAEMGYYSLLENMEGQAEFIGSSFLATKDHRFLDFYMEGIKKTRREDLQRCVKEYIKPECCHRGYIVPANEEEKTLWSFYQKESDLLDEKILRGRSRKTPVEKGKLVHRVKDKNLPLFKYHPPKSFTLDNGLEVTFLHRPHVKKISMLFGLKADYLYESESLGGMSNFIGRLLLEGTRKYDEKSLGRFLDSEGIKISTSSGFVGMEFVSKNLSKGLHILEQIVSEPAFRESSIEKIRKEIVVELQEYWDTPIQFVDDLARKVVYDRHPYAKNRLGHKECIKSFSRKQVLDFYKKFYSPHEANLVLVGDLESYKDESKLRRLLNKNIGAWEGKRVPELVFPEVDYKKPKVIHHKINRDQTVLAFAAPSVSRMSREYDALAVLDFILTGGGISATSRLYQLREQTGLFYTIGGSLVHGSHKDSGMILIKTIVSPGNVLKAEKLIKKTIENLGENGISEAELYFAIKSLMTASVRLFESNSSIAKTFLFFKRCGMNLDLFDKRGSLLSILKIDVVNKIARSYCKENFLSTIRVGRKSVTEEDK